MTHAPLLRTDLAALEEIHQLKHRYLRCVDQKQWDELVDLLTPDAVVDYGMQVYGRPLKVTGRDEIIAYFRARLGPGVITVHAAGQPEITISGDMATGTWHFRDTVISTEHHLAVIGAAFCEDRYARGEDSTWRITSTGYLRTYEAMLSLDDMPGFRLMAGRMEDNATPPWILLDHKN